MNDVMTTTASTTTPSSSLSGAAAAAAATSTVGVKTEDEGERMGVGPAGESEEDAALLDVVLPVLDWLLVRREGALLKEAVKRDVVTHHQLVLGLSRLEKSLDQLQLDVPHAKILLKEMEDSLLS